MNALNLILALGRFRRRLKGYLASAKAPIGFPLRGPRLIVTLAADYPNLGDVALTHSVIDFCHGHLPSHQIFVLPAQQTLKLLRGVARHATPEDIVVIVGGGNLGDRYRRLEELRCEIVKSFPNQRIVSFPQSSEFRSQLTEAYSRKIYAAHPHLTLFARDEASLQRMRKAFPSTKVLLAPDTVLTLTPVRVSATCAPLICLRTDNESRIGSHLRENLIQDMLSTWPQAKSIDTVTQTSTEAYAHELTERLSAFAHASVVITDRLHGLIFARLQQKPCVVIEGVNDKLKSFIDTWLPNAKDVCLVEKPSLESIQHAIERVTAAPTSPALDVALFEPLVSALKGVRADTLKNDALSR